MADWTWRLALAVVLALFAAPAWATIVLEKDFAALVNEADTIVIGTVVTLESSQQQDVPVTLVTFGDLDVVKGTHQEETFTVHVVGGRASDGLRMHIAGTPTFRLGERTVVFVVGNETQAVPFVGLWQGVFRVVQDPDHGDTIATHAGQPLTALPQRRRARGTVHESPPAVRPRQGPALSLEAFRNAITEAVHAR